MELQEEEATEFVGKEVDWSSASAGEYRILQGSQVCSLFRRGGKRIKMIEREEMNLICR